MKPSPSKIQINNPCSENWDAMKVNDQGRFCNSCAKSVIDFTIKSDTEIQMFLQQHKGQKLCGRFYKSQIDRIRIEFDENILYTSIPFWQKFLVIVLVCFGQDFFGYDFCFAQEQDTIPPVKVEQVDTVTTIAEQDSTLEVMSPTVDSIVPIIEVKYLTATCTPLMGSIAMVFGDFEVPYDDPYINLPEMLTAITDTFVDDSIRSENTEMDRDFSNKTPKPKTPKKAPEPSNALIADTGERRQRKK